MTIDRQRRMIWASIWPLKQGELIHVRLNLVDPDGGSAELIKQASIKKMNLDRGDLEEYYFAPNVTTTVQNQGEPFKTWLKRPAKQSLNRSLRHVGHLC